MTQPPDSRRPSDVVARRFYRLRAPWLLDPEGSASVSVRVDGAWDPLLVRVGSGRWGGSLPVDAGWALWRCLDEALRSTGEPPAWLSRDVEVVDAVAALALASPCPPLRGLPWAVAPCAERG